MERIDVRTQAWQDCADMSTARDELAMCALDEHTLLAVGGTAAGAALALAELYDARADRWRATKGMKFVRRGASLVRVGAGALWALGGVDEHGKVVRVVEEFDVRNERWCVVGVGGGEFPEVWGHAGACVRTEE